MPGACPRFRGVSSWKKRQNPCPHGADVLIDTHIMNSQKEEWKGKKRTRSLVGKDTQGEKRGVIMEKEQDKVEAGVPWWLSGLRI